MADEHNQRAWIVWHIEALRRSKRLPKLQTLLVKKRQPSRKQTWQEQMAVMGQWEVAMRKFEAAKARV